MAGIGLKSTKQKGLFGRVYIKKPTNSAKLWKQYSKD